MIAKAKEYISKTRASTVLHHSLRIASSETAAIDRCKGFESCKGPGDCVGSVQE